MKIQFLGTAAAEGYPALFCTCERCKKARALGGKNIRSRSQAIIDDKIIIDFNADAFYHSALYNIDYTNLKTLLITHIHEDHFVPVEINFRNRGFASLDETVTNKLDIYGSVDIAEPLKTYFKDDENYGFNINIKNEFEPFFAEDYKITPLKANHGTANPFIYLIEKDGKTLLYGNDTGIFPDETYQYIENNVKHIDLLILDCTEGTKVIKYKTHMNLERNIIVKNCLSEMGVIDDNSILCLNHFSHNGENTLYEDMCTAADKEGFIVSYDGMNIEF